jgi:hypothetical protein
MSFFIAHGSKMAVLPSMAAAKPRGKFGKSLWKEF